MLTTTALSLGSVATSLVYTLAELLTTPWQLMAGFVGQVMGTAFGGSLQNLSPF
jgi:hypothetical protein